MSLLLDTHTRCGGYRSASIVRSPMAGDPIFVTDTVVDLDGKPVEGARVDVWNTSGEGVYENQDPRTRARPSSSTRSPTSRPGSTTKVSGSPPTT